MLRISIPFSANAVITAIKKKEHPKARAIIYIYNHTIPDTNITKYNNLLLGILDYLENKSEHQNIFNLLKRIPLPSGLFAC